MLCGVRYGRHTEGDNVALATTTSVGIIALIDSETQGVMNYPPGSYMRAELHHAYHL